jgi:hypothetical protein
MVQANQLTMEKKNMNIHKQKPNTIGCEYCGSNFTTFQNTYAGIYCNIECAALRGVRYGYSNLIQQPTIAETSDWNKQKFDVSQYELTRGV